MSIVNELKARMVTDFLRSVSRLKLDVNDKESISEAVKVVESNDGKLDILVNK